MNVTNILLMVLGYLLLIASTKMIEAGGISAMRNKSVSGVQEKLFTWFARSIVPFLGVSIAGGILGLGSMVFAAALCAGVMGLLLVYGMIGISGNFEIKSSNAMRDLIILLVSVVILVLLTNFTWSKGHPASNIGRGAGVFILVLAVVYALWTVPYYIPKVKTGSFDNSDVSDGVRNEKIRKESASYNFIPSVVVAITGVAAAGLGSVLFMNSTAALTYTLGVEQGVLGYTVIGTGLILPEYMRVASRFWKNKKAVAFRGTVSTGNLGLLLMIGLTSVISGITVTFGGVVLLLACVAAIIVFGIMLFVGNNIGKVKAIVFLAVYCAVFLLFMNFSIR